MMKKMMSGNQKVFFLLSLVGIGGTLQASRGGDSPQDAGWSINHRRPSSGSVLITPDTYNSLRSAQVSSFAAPSFSPVATPADWVVSPSAPLDLRQLNSGSGEGTETRWARQRSAQSIARVIQARQAAAGDCAPDVNPAQAVAGASTTED